MTVGELARKDGFKTAVCPEPEREISGVYIGDLLSWVMGKADEGDAWVTIMSNINTIAVASLKDVACIILAEDVTFEPEIIKTAEEKGVNVILSEMTAYEIAKHLFLEGIV